MLRAEAPALEGKVLRVEIPEVSRGDVDGAQAQAGLAAADTVEVHEPLQRFPEVRDVVKARLSGVPLRD